MISGSEALRPTEVDRKPLFQCRCPRQPEKVLHIQLQNLVSHRAPATPISTDGPRAYHHACDEFVRRDVIKLCVDQRHLYTVHVFGPTGACRL